MTAVQRPVMVGGAATLTANSDLATDHCYTHQSATWHCAALSGDARWRHASGCGRSVNMDVDGLRLTLSGSGLDRLECGDLLRLVLDDGKILVSFQLCCSVRRTQHFHLSPRHWKWVQTLSCNCNQCRCLWVCYVVWKCPPSTCWSAWRRAPDHPGRVGIDASHPRFWGD